MVAVIKTTDLLKQLILNLSDIIYKLLHWRLSAVETIISENMRQNTDFR